MNLQRYPLVMYLVHIVLIKDGWLKQNVAFLLMRYLHKNE